MTHARKKLGERGEDAACLYLERKGMQIRERNWKCQFGEADIIMQDHDELVFVEVKARTTEDKGLPEEAVTFKKRQRYERIALEYLFSQDLPSMRIRFDVIALVLNSEDKAFLRHHRDAFGVGY
ncbi:MAG: YraN family protein [Coriobacteriia bacterium]|nr:YraN family protein [Coriobacteriia bacterium]